MLPLFFLVSRNSPRVDIASKSERVTKKYASPSRSPGLGFRVVAETGDRTRGTRSRSAATTVSFPAPDGPETTKSSPGPFSATPLSSHTNEAAPHRHESVAPRPARTRTETLR